MAYPDRPLEVFEILEEFSKAKNKNSRVKVLTKYGDIRAFTDILRGTFDDSLEFNLPEGKPPYTPNIEESIPSDAWHFYLTIEESTHHHLRLVRS